jgi:hypothetical protein
LQLKTPDRKVQEKYNNSNELENLLIPKC